MNKASKRQANAVASKSICLVTLRRPKSWKVGLLEGGRDVAGAGRGCCILALAHAFDWLNETGLIIVNYSNCQ
jgi:hypothetical protein